jgi:hypothetical protein
MTDLCIIQILVAQSSHFFCHQFRATPMTEFLSILKRNLLAAIDPREWAIDCSQRFITTFHLVSLSLWVIGSVLDSLMLTKHAVASSYSFQMYYGSRYILWDAATLLFASGAPYFGARLGFILMPFLGAVNLLLVYHNCGSSEHFDLGNQINSSGDRGASVSGV